MSDPITETQWNEFEENGYLRLGKVVPDAQIETLRARMDEIMLGTAPLDYDRMLMQLDPSSGQPAERTRQTKGHKGATLEYRKIQDLEFDPLFLEYIQHPLFRSICARVYGEDMTIACYRAMFMNKPAGKGSYLNWHQDRWTDLDRDPRVTIWTALDPSTVESGCVHVIPGSHKGLINPESGAGFLAQEHIDKHVAEAEPVPLELQTGEVALLHNWLLHSSSTNHAAHARRAFSTCYLDAATHSKAGHVFPVVFGDGALTPEQVLLEEFRPGTGIV
jgi:phytanoyl-CoA hydroxylase